MRLPESSLFPEDARALTGALLSFLVETDSYYTQTRAVPSIGGKGSADSQRAAALLEESLVEINTCIGLIGGLAVSFKDPDTNCTVGCIVDQWRGYDDTEEGRLAWRIAGTGVASGTGAPIATGEIHLDLGCIVSSVSPML